LIVVTSKPSFGFGWIETTKGGGVHLSFLELMVSIL
jgi:hypothetical protein